MTTHTRLDAATKESIQTLHSRRQFLESEAQAIISELSTPFTDSNGIAVPPMGIDTPLVDSEGFPRADIDVYRARTLRGRLARLRTDHEAMTRQLELLLKHSTEDDEVELALRKQLKPKPTFNKTTGKWVVHNYDGSVFGVDDSAAVDGAAAGEQTTNTLKDNGTSAQSSNDATITTTTPFLRVESVATNSPAAAAGLLANDLILALDTFTIADADFLARIAQHVESVAAAANPQKCVQIKIQRDNLTLSLQPQQWSGQGLLGCHLVPYKTE
jgi:26S proteasome non-ATPase regulatory subunit 9